MIIKKFVSLMVRTCFALIAVLFISNLQVSAQSVEAERDFIVTPSGERLEFGKQYYLRNNTMPHRGGATYSPWLMWDYGILAQNPTDNGTAIVIDYPELWSPTAPYIQNGDEVQIRFVQSNWGSYNWFTISNSRRDLFLNQRERSSIFRIQADSNNNIAFVVDRMSYGDISPVNQLLTLEARDATNAWMEAHPQQTIPFNWTLTPAN